jgi:aminomethyltransferase
MSEATGQSNYQADYAAVRDGGAGLIDFSSNGFVEVAGAEAVMFLNGLITNDVKKLEDNSWMLAAFPNVQGRLIALGRVLRLGDKFLFDTENATSEAALNSLSRFTLAGDFRVADLRGETALISIQGAKAADVIHGIFGKEVANVERNRIVSINNSFIIRATHTAEDGFDIFCNDDEKNALIDSLINAGAMPVGPDALEVLRIEAGLPRYGVDMNETTVVLETGLDEAVSFTKGCYVGQEIIARIHWRGHVAKKLSGIALEESGPVKAEDKIKTPEGSKDIGRITSVTFSPRLQKTIALGYVRHEHLAAETEVRIATDEKELAARVVELPFVRGSWFKAAS